jgi:Lectin C-type domain
MTNLPRPLAALQCSFLLCGALGCVSLEKLSSYSDGAGLATSGLGQQPDASDGVAVIAPAPTSDGGLVGGSTSEATPGAGIALEPSEVLDAGDACSGPGEFRAPGRNSCYRLISTPSAWSDARALCVAWGGDLAEIETRGENALLTDYCDVDVWLGAGDPDGDGVIRWNSGGTLTFAAWGAGQPDDFLGGEKCVELRALDDRWNDEPCTQLDLPLCERADSE